MYRNNVVTEIRNLARHKTFSFINVFVLAIPFTYCLLHQWLQNDSFKTGANPPFFLLPVLLILLITIATISTQTQKTASANTVKNLRTEQRQCGSVMFA